VGRKLKCENRKIKKRDIAQMRKEQVLEGEEWKKECKGER
jgi:hypothetical protein